MKYIRSCLSALYNCLGNYILVPFQVLETYRFQKNPQKHFQRIKLSKLYFKKSKQISVVFFEKLHAIPSLIAITF